MQKPINNCEVINYESLSSPYPTKDGLKSIRNRVSIVPDLLQYIIKREMRVPAFFGVLSHGESQDIFYCKEANKAPVQLHQDHSRSKIE